LSNPEAAKTQTQILKKLREERKETIAKKKQEYLKEQLSVRKNLKKAMGSSEMTVPEIASATGIPAHIVLWHIIAMKKYGQVSEVGKDDEYYQYALTSAKESNA